VLLQGGADGSDALGAALAEKRGILQSLMAGIRERTRAISGEKRKGGARQPGQNAEDREICR